MHTGELRRLVMMLILKQRISFKHRSSNYNKLIFTMARNGRVMLVLWKEVIARIKTKKGHLFGKNSIHDF
jgi:hypothetical protein